MTLPIYIRSTSAITPQHTFSGTFPGTIVSTEDNRLPAVDADYTKFISPVAIRRMSRLIKMGITAGMQCLQDAGVALPDAIITGTAHGSMTDMEHFVKDMIRLNEEALNPTYFIQSTYNSVNGWLAMQSKCTGYNQTYVHRGYAFELALLDTFMMLREAPATKHILVGGYDELTDDFFIAKGKLDYWKKDLINSYTLLAHSDSTGTIAGEGAIFFAATNDKTNALCSVEAIRLLQDATDEDILYAVAALLQEQNLATADIDLLILGLNGDKRTQPLYEQLAHTFPGDTVIAAFKHLCGEYDTATAFGMWLATECYRKQQVPEVAIVRKGFKNAIRYTLLVNRYVLNNASVILMKNAGG